MPRATFVIELDLNDDDVYEQNITQYVMSASLFRGRNDSSDSGRESRLDLTLKNNDGRFSPKNTSSPYYPNLTTFKRIRVRTTSPSTTQQFTGYITSISIESKANKQSAGIIAIDDLTYLRSIRANTRLMRDKDSGVVVHRYIDHAEVPELITNPSGDVGTAGYSSEAGGSVTREIVEPIFEGNAVLQAYGSGNKQGVRYDITSIAGTGTSYIFGVYVAPRSYREVGKLVSLEAVSNASTIAAFATCALIEHQWTPLRAGPVTFPSGATQRYLRVCHSAGGQGSFYWGFGGLHGVRTVSAIPRNVERGRAKIPYAGLLQESIAAGIEEIRQNELGGFFYFDGGGTARYEERSHRWASTASVATFNEPTGMTDMTYEEAGEDRFSRVEITYAGFDVGAPSTYIWSLELPTSRYIAPGATAEILADYGFLAKDTIIPVANTDYRINSAADGSGQDLTGSVPLTFTPFAKGANHKLVNNAGKGAWITQLANRGTPIRDVADRPIHRYTPSSGPPVDNPLTIGYSLQDKLAHIEPWAQYLGDKFDSQVERISITLKPATVSLLQQMLSRQVSDRITVINDDKAYSSKVNGDYYIESIRHRIGGGGFLHDTIFSLSQADPTFWILDTSALNVSTKLGP